MWWNTGVYRRFTTFAKKITELKLEKLKKFEQETVSLLAPFFSGFEVTGHLFKYQILPILPESYVGCFESYLLNFKPLLKEQKTWIDLSVMNCYQTCFTRISLGSAENRWKIEDLSRIDEENQGRPF